MAAPDFSWPVRRLDAWLRVRLGIEEFTADPDCIFRISREPARRSLTLEDGAAIRRGDPALQVHLWNEHLPLMTEEGRTAAWANLFKRRMTRSFELLADYVEREPRFDDIVAIHASPPFSERLGAESLRRLCQRVGWEIVPPAAPSDRWHAWLDSMLLLGLLWSFQPAGLRGRGVAHGRIEVWMSRAKLFQCYGSGQGAGRADADAPSMVAEQP